MMLRAIPSSSLVRSRSNPVCVAVRIAVYVAVCNIGHAVVCVALCVAVRAAAHTCCVTREKCICFIHGT